MERGRGRIIPEKRERNRDIEEVDVD